MASKLKERKRTPVSHKVIEKRRRDRINRCLNELGKTVPMALAKQSSGKLEKAEILEMTVQYLRALHAAEFPRGREKGLLAEFAGYFQCGYRECLRNLVHYLSTEGRPEPREAPYARVLAFLQSKARFAAEPLFASAGALPEPDFRRPPPPAAECPARGPAEPVFPPGAGGPFSWAGPARSPGAPFLPLAAPGPLDRGCLGLLGPPAPAAFGLPHGQPPALL